MTRKLLFVLSGLVTLFVLALGQGAQAAQQGITIAPAALRLELAQGQQPASTTFTVTNYHSSSVQLNFGVIADDSAELDTIDVSRLVDFEHVLMTLEAGQSQQQTISLRQDESITPGSHVAEVVVHNDSGTMGGIGIVPNVHLPLTLVQLDGAVSAFTATAATGNGSFISLPNQATIELRNTGNMIVIPRGTVQLVDPRGDIISQGVLNQESLALSPKGELKLQTPLTRLDTASWPGSYRLVVNYGLGGGSATEQFTTSHWYVAWWHGLLLAALIATGIWGVPHGKRHLRSWKAKRHKSKVRPKRPPLLGRDIT